MICVPLKLNVMKRNLVALLSEHPLYFETLFYSGHFEIITQFNTVDDRMSYNSEMS